MDAAGLTYGRLILHDLCAFLLFGTCFLLFRALRVSPGDASSVAALSEAALYLPSCTRDVTESHRRMRGLASEVFYYYQSHCRHRRMLPLRYQQC
jgi:hypothetical protein